MPRDGRQPEVGLEPKPCANCGKMFQPYRSHHIACSRPCREKTKELSPRRQVYDLSCRVCGVDFQAEWTGMGRQPACADCTARLAREKQVRHNIARRGRPDILEYSKRYNFSRYGITQEQFEEMFEAQGGVCAICGSAATPGIGPASQRLHVDHDHRTGKVRALLCNNCNRGLGYLQDDYELLLKAVAYLKEFENVAS